jgi:predicted nucleotidyltransferase
MQKAKTLNEIKEIVAQHKEELKQDYFIGEIGVFGSYSRGQQRKSSDIDILVEFEKPVGLFKFLKLETYLSNLLGTKVDLVTKPALKPRIGERILQEVVYL